MERRWGFECCRSALLVGSGDSAGDCWVDGVAGVYARRKRRLRSVRIRLPLPDIGCGLVRQPLFRIGPTWSGLHLFGSGEKLLPMANGRSCREWALRDSAV